MKIDKESRERMAAALHYELGALGFQRISSWPPSDAKQRAKIYLLADRLIDVLESRET